MTDQDKTPLGALCPGSLYQRLCREETGNGEVSPDALAKRRADAAKLKCQTVHIAERLEKKGVKCYRNDKFFFYFYRVHTRELEQLLPFSRRMILPAIAAAVRRPILKAAESFIERHPFCRFWTFTNGPRCTVAELRPRLRSLHRDISDLNAQDFMRAAGVQIVLRCSEIGTPEFEPGEAKAARQTRAERRREKRENEKAGAIQRNQDGAPTYHPHAHCVLHIENGPLPHDAWCRLIDQVRSFWKWHFDAGDMIENARELVKYMVKPAALMALSDNELVALADATARLKMVQPMGALAAEIADRKERGFILVRQKTPEGYIWTEGRNFNAYEGPAVDVTEEKPANPDKRPALAITARCLPSIGPAGVKEPGVVIRSPWRLTSDALLRDNAIVAQIREHTAELFAAGVLARSRRYGLGAAPVLSAFTPAHQPPADPPDDPPEGKTGRKFALAEYLDR